MSTKPKVQRKPKSLEDVKDEIYRASQRIWKFRDEVTTHMDLTMTKDFGLIGMRLGIFNYRGKRAGKWFAVRLDIDRDEIREDGIYAFVEPDNEVQFGTLVIREGKFQIILLDGTKTSRVTAMPILGVQYILKGALRPVGEFRP